MDLEKEEILEDNSCSICLEIVVVHGDRSIAKLHCGHYFHLDCIGSAFNAKGSMQCPNCRKVEKGRWLFANGQGQRSLGPDLDFEGWLPDDSYDHNYSEQSFGFRWCPFGGVTQLASLLEDGNSQLNSYLEPLTSTTYTDHPNTSSTAHVCPYVVMHGHCPHAMHIAGPSSSRDSENNAFSRHSNNLGVQQQPSNDMMNSHSFTSIEPQGQNWQQRQNSHSYNFLGNGADPWMLRDVGNQQRSGSFVYQRPVNNGRSGSHRRTNAAAPNNGGEEQHMSQNHQSSNGSHQMYHQHTAPSSSAPFHPLPSSGEYYGFATLSDYDWSRGVIRGEHSNSSLPWIPLEGESQWWGPFTPPSSAPQLRPRMPPRSSSYM